MRRVLVSALAFSLSGSPALAQSLRDSARTEAAKFAVAQAGQPANDAYRPGGMSPGYFWTAIGLMSAGGVYLASGAILKGSESDLCYDFDIDCGGIGKGVMVLGAGLVGTGVLLLVLGKNKARVAGNPQIVAVPRGFAVRSRFAF